MPVPIQPVNLIPRPFASGGGATYQIIPDAPTTYGRASFKQGFPTETQVPLREGGVAPNRMDFQGLFNLLTAFGFWQQSGGLWSYKADLNYALPAVVFHNGVLWWCLKENGPDSAEGRVEPGTNEQVWLAFLNYLTGSSGETSTLGNPVGTVIMFWGTTAPEGYFSCDGSPFSAFKNPKLATLLGGTVLPDFRGLFIRGYDTRSSVDPEGASRNIGSIQQDSMQAISGAIYTGGQKGFSSASGAFAVAGVPGHDWAYRGAGTSFYGTVTIDTSRVARTSPETRGKNASLLYCIKHD